MGNRFVLNLGLRYDYYGQVKVRPTTDVPVEIVNYEAPTDLRKMDFGPLRDPLRPYQPDGGVSGREPDLRGPWTSTSERWSAAALGLCIAPPRGDGPTECGEPVHPLPNHLQPNGGCGQTHQWPIYTDESVPFALADAGGKRSVFSLFDPDIQVPYTIQSMVSVQRSFGQTLAAEVGYLRTDGRDFPLQRQFTQAFDRETGARPNPALGAPGGYYVDSGQTMLYNGLQTSIHKRFKNSYSWEVNYTLGKSEATQSGDVSGILHRGLREQPGLLGSRVRPRAGRNDIRHRLNGSFIVELPGIPSHQVLNAVLGGWQLSGIAQWRSGSALRVQQPWGSTGAGLTSSPASTWCSPIGGTAAMPEAALT